MEHSIIALHCRIRLTGKVSNRVLVFGGVDPCPESN